MQQEITLFDIKSFGLEEGTSNYIQQKFTPFLEQVNEWKEKARTLVVTDISQKEEMKLARESRLAIRAIRVNADKVRKDLKEDSLRYGRAVQGIYNVIEDSLKPIEEYLEEQEKFEERLNLKIKEELRAKREEVARPYREFMPSSFDLTILDDASFEMMVQIAKTQYDKRKEEERLIEEERLKVEKEKEQEMAILRQALQEKAKLEAILRDKERAEKEELKRQKSEARRLKNAPDKIKLSNFALWLENIAYPSVNSEDATLVLDEAKERIKEVIILIRKQSENL